MLQLLKSRRIGVPTALAGWIALAAVLLVELGDRKPADPARALGVHGSTPPKHGKSSTLLHVATFNIHGGKGTDGIVDLVRIAELLNGADLIGLNEVRNTWPSSQDQSHQLGQLMKCRSVFLPTERQWGRDHFGNGLLSTLPIRSIHRIPLVGTRGKAFRQLALAELEWPGETTSTSLRVIVAHLDGQADRAIHLNAAFDLFEAIEPPVVLMGDFNSTADDDVLSARLQRLADDPEFENTMSRIAPPQKHIDWILTRGMQAEDVAVIPTKASDHPVVRATLRLKVTTGKPGTDPSSR